MHLSQNEIFEVIDLISFFLRPSATSADVRENSYGVKMGFRSVQALKKKRSDYKGFN